MSSSQLLAGLATALLVFWAVGGYNRLVRLRSDIAARFAAVDARLGERQGLLERQLELVAAALASAGPRLEALRAAALQAEAAREHARLRPGVPGAITSLRVAEDILADARARLPAVSGGDGLTELHAQLQGVDAAFAFARAEFNAAVTGYNDAVRQFPTVVLARVFGFRAAGNL